MADAKPKLSTKTPDDETVNALKAAGDDILAMPKTRRFVVAELITTNINTHVSDGQKQATVQLTHIELLSEADGEKVLGKAYTARTGNKTLPVAVEDTPLDLGSTDLEDDGV